MNVASDNTPSQVYRSRLETHTTALHKLEKRSNQIANYRALIALLFCALIGIERGLGNPGLALLALAFLILVLWHHITKKSIALCQQRIAYYTGCIKRLEGRWQQQPDGLKYKEATHPYTDALDVFGPHSLFQLLCTATTEPGQRTLASWLKSPAKVAEIKARQEAITELKPNLCFRENAFIIGHNTQEDLALESLETWCMAKPSLSAQASKIACIFMSLLTFASIVSATIALMDITTTPLLICFALQIFARIVMNDYIQDTTGQLLETTQILSIISTLIQHFESIAFQNEKLQNLKASFTVDGLPAAKKIKQLANLADWFFAEKNQLFLPIALLLGWGPLFALKINQWRNQSGHKVTTWFNNVGEIEALLALTHFAYENPQGQFPKLVNSPKGLSGHELGHPLLVADKRVCNDIQLDRGRQLLMVSGSNMSGKSTYLRTVGVNVILAQSGSITLAKSLTLSPLLIGATLDVNDSIQEGKSKFYAEISKIKSIIDLTETAKSSDANVLFLLDELLHGTNSIDRKKGAELIINAFLTKEAFGMITTHDLVLTQTHENTIHNVHFTDEFDGVQLQFDYKLREGVVTHSNAMQIIKNVGIV